MSKYIEMVREDAEALGCWTEVQATRLIVANGSSADRQRSTHATAIATGASTSEAHREVVNSLIAEFTEGLDGYTGSADSQTS